MSTSLTQIHGHSGACFVCLLSHISSCLRIIYCRSPRNVRTWRYQQGRPLWTQVRREFEFELGTGFDAVLCKLGRRLAVLLSLLFLHRFNRFIPHHPYRSVSRIGMPLFTQAIPSMNLTVFSFSGRDLRMSLSEVATTIQYVSVTLAIGARTDVSSHRLLCKALMS